MLWIRLLSTNVVLYEQERCSMLREHPRNVKRVKALTVCVWRDFELVRATQHGSRCTWPLTSRCSQRERALERALKIRDLHFFMPCSRADLLAHCSKTRGREERASERLLLHQNAFDRPPRSQCASHARLLSSRSRLEVVTVCFVGSVAMFVVPVPRHEARSCVCALLGLHA